MIRAEQLSKSYAGKEALRELTFSAGRGTVLGFIGPNGAGKSTAMKILCGIMPPSSGRVFVDQTEMTAFPEKAKRFIGYLPENAPLYPGMNVISFLNYCGNMRGLCGKELRKAVGKAAEICHLEEVLHEETEALSKGFRRRVCLAQCLLHEPENLILDEPTDGLDPDQKREIRSLIASLKDKVTIIVSTHILEEVDAVCTGVLAIRKGRKVFDGTTEEFRKLSPDSGKILLRQQGGDPAFYAKALPGTPVHWERENGEWIITFSSGTESREVLTGKVMNLAGGSGGTVLACSLPPVRLGEIFARLGKEEDEVQS